MHNLFKGVHGPPYGPHGLAPGDHGQHGVVQGVLAAVEAPGGLGADGTGRPEGGGQVPHLEWDLRQSRGNTCGL